MDGEGQLNVGVLRLIDGSSRQCLDGQDLEGHEERRGVDRDVLTDVEMDLQGIHQQRECRGGLVLNLSGQLSLIVQIAASLDRLPREVITVREQI